jgi:hypothetical protein
MVRATDCHRICERRRAASVLPIVQTLGREHVIPLYPADHPPCNLEKWTAIRRPYFGLRTGIEPDLLHPKQETIKYLQRLFAGVKDLAPRNLDASWTPKPGKLVFGLHVDSASYGSSRALTRAVVIPSVGRLETTTNWSYI